MRYIDDMLKMIPLDEMGGTDMTDNITENRTNITSTRTNDGAEVKVRRGAAAAVAAALVLTVGAGAFALSKAGKASRDITPAAAVSEDENANTRGSTPTDGLNPEADETALKAFNSILDLCTDLIADGKQELIPVGEYDMILSEEPDDYFGMLLFGAMDEGSRYEFPKQGELIVVIDEGSYMPKFLQWREYRGTPVGQVEDGQYFENTRMPFGLLPKAYETETHESSEKNIHAYELFNACKLTVDPQADGWEYPDKMEWDLLPAENLLLDFDKREQYADVMALIEKRAGRTFTGQAYVGFYPYAGEVGFVEWRENEDSVMERWPAAKTETAPFGKAMTADGTVLADIPERLAGQEGLAEDLYNTIGCTLAVPRANGSFDGRICYHSDIPEVESWYREFLTKGYEPVAYDPEKKIAAVDIDRLVEFDFIDTEALEPVFIRTSDMEGANIYVNGRYYNVEDDSVLHLLDEGLPPSIPNYENK